MRTVSLLRPLMRSIRALSWLLHFTSSRMLHAAARPAEQREPDLFFEAVHHMRQAGLRTAQLRGRFGERSGLD